MLISETIKDWVMGTHVVSPVTGSVPVPKRRVKSSKTRKPEICPVSYLYVSSSASVMLIVTEKLKELYEDSPKQEPADTGENTQKD